MKIIGDRNRGPSKPRRQTYMTARMSLLHDIADFLYDSMEANDGMTQRELADRLKMRESQLSRILSCDANVTIDTVARLFWAFGIVPDLAAPKLKPEYAEAPAPIMVEAKGPKTITENASPETDQTGWITARPTWDQPATLERSYA